MSIQLVSISHKTAPVAMRAKFAFSPGQQLEIMKAIIQESPAEECVILATCNRTEVYTYCASEGKERKVFEVIQKVLSESAGMPDDESMGDLLRFYQGNKAIHHLFDVTTGLDSMVIGEDQILGQVKNAHAVAMKEKMCSTFLNTFFRYAITASKKVKTDTLLSKTPVSTATIAVKAAEEFLGDLTGKKIMLLGATGKIGSVVYKNLMADYAVELYLTIRDQSRMQKHQHESRTITQYIPYENRYELLDEMDVIISATTSPHYTMVYEKVKKSLKTPKKRAFVDLAVPLDIESRIGEIEDTMCYNIDDFSQVAKENNNKKLEEAKMAREILEDYELQFKRWMIFQKNFEVMKSVEADMVHLAEEKSIVKAVDKLFYRVRESASPEDLEVFFRCLKYAE